jgi:hypothetical protein
MSEFVRIPPSVHLLQSYRGLRPHFCSLLNEAVDNSFDAGADHVAIALERDLISVRDNGRGVSNTKWEKLVELGGHAPSDTTSLGRYGVGLKTLAVAAGNTMAVTSVSHESGKMSLFVDWDKVIDGGDWSFPAAKFVKATSSSTYTWIEISELKRRLTASDTKRARDDLIKTFEPALRAGCIILLNNERLLAPDDPILKDKVSKVIMLSPEKGARILGGITLTDRDPNGVTVTYRHRVIESRSGFGCNGHSISGMFGRVDLIGSWDLSTYKDKVIDDDADALQQQILEAFEPFLVKCKTASMDARIRGLQAELNEMLPAEISAVRPKKERDLGRSGEKRGKIGYAPGAPESPTGPARSDNVPHGKIAIFFERGAEGDGVGWVTNGRPARINLNLYCPQISYLSRLRDQKLAKLQLFTIAMSLLLLNQHQLDLPFKEGSPGARLWELVRDQGIILDEPSDKTA